MMLLPKMPGNVNCRIHGDVELCIAVRPVKYVDDGKEVKKQRGNCRCESSKEKNLVRSFVICFIVIYANFSAVRILNSTQPS
jgi:hypothetical protein